MADDKRGIVNLFDALAEFLESQFLKDEELTQEDREEAARVRVVLNAAIRKAKERGTKSSLPD